MEKKLLQLGVIGLLLTATAACWGYRGPLYHWTKDDVVFYDVRRNSICFKETSREVFYVDVLWGRSGYFQHKDIGAGHNCYLVPDSISQNFKNRKSHITVFCKNNTNAYIIDISKSDWKNKNYVYGFPLNDITNDKEMHNEILKLDKETNRKR